MGVERTGYSVKEYQLVSNGKRILIYDWLVFEYPDPVPISRRLNLTGNELILEAGRYSLALLKGD